MSKCSNCYECAVCGSGTIEIEELEEKVDYFKQQWTAAHWEMERLDKKYKELEKKLQRVKDSSPIECPDCFDAIADGYTICGDCSC